MATIEVRDLGDNLFRVTVRARSTTEHEVTVRPDYAAALAGADADTAALVERSFEFLLEREPNTAILSHFDLSVIERYFPEYRREIPGRLAR